MKNTQTIVVSALTALVIVTGLYLFTKDNSNKLGTVSVGSEYLATTTRPTSTNYGSFPTLYLLRSGAGAVGDVLVTGAAAGSINLYDATTSSVLLRTGRKATSSIIITSIPPSATAQNYPIDATFSDGLLIEIIGTTPTSTVKWR